MTNGLRVLAASGLTLVLAAGSALAQGANAQPAQAAANQNVADRDVPGPIDSLQDLQDTGKMLFKMADTNNDNQISQKEAIDAANLIVGGFFFRADANGDGTVSADEARQAREALFQQKPWLRYIAESARQARAQGANGATPNPAQGLANFLDTNNDKQLQASELRQAVQTAVQGAFAAADTNRDNQLSPSEVNAALIGAANTVAQAAFRAADKDNNGQLSQEEFLQSLAGPARTAFQVLDLNHDNQLSPQELQRIQQVLTSQLRNLQVPEPANSPANLIRSGQAPAQAAPVPGVNATPATTPR